MTQPSILKGMRNLRDAQTSVMTTAPAQLGFVLERTSLTLYTLSVSIKKQLRFRKNWNLNWIVYFTCDQNVIFHILLWKGNEFCCNCGQRLPSNSHFLEQNYVERKPRLDPKEAYTLCKYWNELYGSEASFCGGSREKSGSMQFIETNEVSSRSPRELKFVRYNFRLEDL